MATATAAAGNGPTAFHDVIAKDHAVYQPEKNRYVLYVSYACPWASRCLVARKVKELVDFIKVIPVDPVSNDESLWQFTETFPDPINNAKILRDVYLLSTPDYAGRFSVPVLFDTKTKKVVNNESAEIVRIFNSGFNDVIAKPSIDLYPEPLRKEIDNINDWVYSDINRGVYKAGFFGFFAHNQQDYETNCMALFAALDRVEVIFGKQKFLAGDVFTEADIRLFTTIVRMPTVYECHFKCNLKTLRDGSDYPNIHNWVKMVYQIHGVAETVKQDHIKRHYYMSHKGVNPSRFVPLYDGPDLSKPSLRLTESDFVWFK